MEVEKEVEKMGDIVLTMKGISKNFPGVKALDTVDFTLRAGEIHALMGENGAGKSTLIKVLTGVHEFETGEIRVAGIDHPIINHSPQESQKNGISTVYQEVNLCPNLSVAENIYIGREPRKAGFISWKEMNSRAQKLLDDLQIPVGNFTYGLTNMVGYIRDYSLKVDDYEIEYDLQNTIFKNGVSVRWDFADKWALNGSYAYTFYSGSELFVDEYHDTGLALIRKFEKGNFFSGMALVGNYSFGSNDYQAYRLGINLLF